MPIRSVLASLSRPHRPQRGNPARPRGASVLAIFGLWVACAAVATPSMALTNGDFSSGLTGWSSYGAASEQGGVLVLDDTGPSASGSWQVTATQGTRTILDFDIFGALSDFTPADPFGFSDIFNASIYLLDDSAGFDPTAGIVMSAVSVLSLDSGGPFDVNAEITAADLGADWLHVSFEFDSPSAYLAPSFELFELALVGGDSRVLIDNVVLAPIPEPGTALLVLLGLGTISLGRRRNGRR
jgi:hypothetical protein